MPALLRIESEAEGLERADENICGWSAGRCDGSCIHSRRVTRLTIARVPVGASTTDSRRNAASVEGDQATITGCQHVAICIHVIDEARRFDNETASLEVPCR
jgi:hypothetical protein